MNSSDATTETTAMITTLRLLSLLIATANPQDDRLISIYMAVQIN
jgi:hypothetical protein